MWGIKCLGRCGEAVPPLKTSVSLYGDDFEINHQINYATISCAVPFERLNDFMRTIGYAAPLPAPPSPRAAPPRAGSPRAGSLRSGSPSARQASSSRAAPRSTLSDWPIVTAGGATQYT